MRLTYYLWNGGYQGMLPWCLSQLSLGNTIFAMGIMFVAMDLLYAPLHHFLHLPSMYPLIHKHHHRQHFPVRGYLDAGNEHPIEHMIGVMCTWFAVCTAEVLLPTIKMLWEVVIKTDELPAKRDALASLGLCGGGVHTVTVFIFFQLHAALAMMNHSPFDAQFSLPFVGSSLLFGSESSRISAMDCIPIIGKRLRRVISGQWFRYSVGHHEMHHRKFNYNYAQYCLFYDHWMGTFIPYEGPKTASELEAKKKTKSS
jgi:sterol desaturase/sphingolipid hydroxylase (fatty acid hydroxylase superfamily)